jgi:hypothetical protein
MGAADQPSRFRPEPGVIGDLIRGPMLTMTEERRSSPGRAVELTRQVVSATCARRVTASS